MNVSVYIEGGGDTELQQTRLRKAVSSLLGRAGIRSPRAPRVVLCGSREETFKQFKSALLRRPEVRSLLLVDAESAVSGPVSGASAWRHLHQQDRWPRPDQLDDDQVHLMVELMESWLLCNRDSLAAHFGKGFVPSRLPGLEAAVESIPKQQVLSGLQKSTSASSRGTYNKSRDSALLLETLDPQRLSQAAPYFARFLEVLRHALAV